MARTVASFRNARREVTDAAGADMLGLAMMAREQRAQPARSEGFHAASRNPEGSVRQGAMPQRNGGA
jgi:hypothetical protein